MHYRIADMQYKSQICWIFRKVSQKYCHKNTLDLTYIDIKILCLREKYERKNA